jgi:NitT/TauT family transport system substrate-binding protein
MLSDHRPVITRRRLLSGIGAVGATRIGPARAAGVAVRVGFVPVIGAAALYVVDKAGWARDAGIDLVTTKFDSGPAAVQAFASGTFDLLAIGVSPVAVVRSRGFDARVVAAGGSGGSEFIASADLAKRFAAPGSTTASALSAFRRETGRRAKLATLPPGGVPTVALNHWLFKAGHVDRDDVEIVAIGIEAVQQAMLAGAVDGATVLEPSATIVLQRNPGLKVIATALQMFPDIPGVVFAVSGPFLARQRAAVESLVRLLSRATDLIKSRPEEAAPHVAATLGGGLIDPATMTRAMTSKAIAFVSDPQTIIGPTESLLAYQSEIGDFARPPDTAGLFDLSVWAEASARK